MSFQRRNRSGYLIENDIHFSVYWFCVLSRKDSILKKIGYSDRLDWYYLAHFRCCRRRIFISWSFFLMSTMHWPEIAHSLYPDSSIEFSYLYQKKFHPVDIKNMKKRMNKCLSHVIVSLSHSRSAVMRHVIFWFHFNVHTFISVSPQCISLYCWICFDRPNQTQYLIVIYYYRLDDKDFSGIFRVLCFVHIYFSSVCVFVRLSHSFSFYYNRHMRKLHCMVTYLYAAEEERPNTFTHLLQIEWRERRRQQQRVNFIIGLKW